MCLSGSQCMSFDRVLNLHRQAKSVVRVGTL